MFQRVEFVHVQLAVGSRRVEERSGLRNRQMLFSEGIEASKVKDHIFKTTRERTARDRYK